MSRHARTVALLLLGLSFVVGGVAGMALQEAFDFEWFESLEREHPGDEQLVEGLELTPAQEARIEVIQDRLEDRLEAYWEGRLPEIRAIMEESYAEIRAVLTPQQRLAFDRRVRELRGRVPEEVRD